MKNGTFSSPIIINHQNHSRQCIYTFIAGENEKVQISFSDFHLRGTTPEYVLSIESFEITLTGYCISFNLN